jgi:nitrous oxide reductase accessory protein NosL
MKKQLIFALILSTAIASCDNAKTTTEETPATVAIPDTTKEKIDLPTQAPKPDIIKEMLVLQKS